jgi:hypothetical protein
MMSDQLDVAGGAASDSARGPRGQSARRAGPGVCRPVRAPMVPEPAGRQWTQAAQRANPVGPECREPARHATSRSAMSELNAREPIGRAGHAPTRDGDATPAVRHR